jgi:hypothetical protein
MQAYSVESLSFSGISALVLSILFLVAIEVSGSAFPREVRPDGCASVVYFSAVGVRSFFSDHLLAYSMSKKRSYQRILHRLFTHFCPGSIRRFDFSSARFRFSDDFRRIDLDYALRRRRAPLTSCAGARCLMPVAYFFMFMPPYRIKLLMSFLDPWQYSVG